jgi:hypothetical protein
MSYSNDVENVEPQNKLFHVQTKKSFDLPNDNTIVFIGKQDIPQSTDIDVSNLPNQEIVSRLHATIEIQDNHYYLKDLGSANGTFLNKIKLIPHQDYKLTFSDKIELGKDGKVVFLFQQNKVKLNRKKMVNSISKLTGGGLMTAGVIIFASSTRIGLFAGFPGLLLSLAGIFFLYIKKENALLGQILLMLGIGIIFVGGGFFANINLLSLIISSFLIFIGYQLFHQGKILKYDLSSLFNNKKT